MEVSYIILRPNCEQTVMCGLNRQQRTDFSLSKTALQNMWEMFRELGDYESDVLNTTGQTLEQSAQLVMDRLSCGAFAL